MNSDRSIANSHSRDFNSNGLDVTPRSNGANSSAVRGPGAGDSKPTFVQKPARKQAYQNDRPSHKAAHAVTSDDHPASYRLVLGSSLLSIDFIQPCNLWKLDGNDLAETSLLMSKRYHIANIATSKEETRSVQSIVENALFDLLAMRRTKSRPADVYIQQVHGTSGEHLDIEQKILQDYP